MQLENNTVWAQMNQRGQSEMGQNFVQSNQWPQSAGVVMNQPQVQPLSQATNNYSDYSPMKKSDPNVPYAQRQKMIL